MIERAEKRKLEDLPVEVRAHIEFQERKQELLKEIEEEKKILDLLLNRTY